MIGAWIAFAISSIGFMFYQFYFHLNLSIPKFFLNVIWIGLVIAGYMISAAIIITEGVK